MIPSRFRAYKKRVEFSNVASRPASENVSAEDLKKHADSQRARMDSYKIGSQDNVGNKIVKIFSRGDDFLIYEIEGAIQSELFRVLVDTVIDADPNGYVKRYEEIKPSIDEFRSILHKGVHDKSVKHRAASAVSTALRGDVKGAKLIFEKINEQVQLEYKNISDGRLNYLGSSFAALMLFCVISILFYIFRNNCFILKNPLIKSFFYAASFSALGGFFSVCTNLKDIEFERSLVWWKYAAYGIQRIILAASCGVISYLLISSDIFLSFITKSSNATLSIMAICVLSGFSETLIPNALRRLESKEE